MQTEHWTVSVHWTQTLAEKYIVILLNVAIAVVLFYDCSWSDIFDVYTWVVYTRFGSLHVIMNVFSKKLSNTVDLASQYDKTVTNIHSGYTVACYTLQSHLKVA